jgi:hypothetical protein
MVAGTVGGLVSRNLGSTWFQGDPISTSTPSEVAVVGLVVLGLPAAVFGGVEGFITGWLFYELRGAVRKGAFLGLAVGVGVVGWAAYESPESLDLWLIAGVMPLAGSIAGALTMGFFKRLGRIVGLGRHAAEDGLRGGGPHGPP